MTTKETGQNTLNFTSAVLIILTWIPSMEVRIGVPKWKKDAKVFKVAVHHNEDSGYHTASIPKPIIDHLGKGEKVDEIEYAIKGSRIELSSRQSRTEA